MRPQLMSSAPIVHIVENRRRLFARAVVAAAALVCICATVIFFGVGRWLLVEDPLERADAIVILSGRLPIRALEAARLYRAGYAPQVWLTRTIEPAASLQSMHIAYIGEEFFNTQVLMHEGVPSNAVRVLDTPVENTADEVRLISDELVRLNRTNVIIVTTKPHSRRARTLWKKLSGGHGHAIVRAASGDPFDPAHWWRNSHDVLDVVREVLGMVNAWAGLPLRPTT